MTFKDIFKVFLFPIAVYGFLKFLIFRHKESNYYKKYCGNLESKQNIVK